MAEIWKQFENRIEEETKAGFGVTCWRVPANVRLLPDGKRPVVVKSNPDFCAGIFGLAAFFDAKATESKAWNIKDNVLRHDKSANKIHQWEKLVTASSNGNIAGYLIWFYNLKVICWVSVETLKDLMAQGYESVTPVSPGVIFRPDDRLIDLKEFFHKDIEARRFAIRGVS